jgi:hypothetical protein
VINAMIQLKKRSQCDPIEWCALDEDFVREKARNKCMRISSVLFSMSDVLHKAKEDSQTKF